MSSPVNYTVVPAVVTKNKDKDKNNLGRIKVRYPWMDDTQESDWLPVVSPGAGKERGLYAVPEVHDQVLVAFGYGDPNRGYVLGALWSKDDKPPSDDPALRVFKSVSGHVVTFDDTKGQELISIVDKSGKNKVVLDAKNNKITIESGGDLVITAGGALTLEAKQDLAIKAASISIEAKRTMTLDGPQGVKVNKDALEVI